MAISVTWGVKIIYVPQNYLSVIGGGVYGLDVDLFRLDLKDLEDNVDGMPFPDTHRHNTEVTLAGATYARTIEVINGYTVEFEDGQYTVLCSGANHNLADVKVLNQVSIIVANAAGLIVSDLGPLTPSQETELTTAATESTSAHTEAAASAIDAALARKLDSNKAIVSLDDLTVTVYDDDGVSVLYVFDISADKRQRIPQ